VAGAAVPPASATAVDVLCSPWTCTQVIDLYSGGEVNNRFPGLQALRSKDLAASR
jgi:hypothetical protein